MCGARGEMGHIEALSCLSSTLMANKFQTKRISLVLLISGQTFLLAYALLQLCRWYSFQQKHTHNNVISACLLLYAQVTEMNMCTTLVICLLKSTQTQYISNIEDYETLLYYQKSPPFHRHINMYTFIHVTKHITVLWKKTLSRISKLLHNI